MQAPFLEQCQQAGERSSGLESPGVPVLIDGAHRSTSSTSLRPVGNRGMSRRAGSPVFLAPGTLSMFFKMPSRVPNSWQQLGGRLDTDARHARHIIDRIADQRLQINDLLGCDAPVGEEFGPAKLLPFAEIEHPYLVGEELPAILVGGADEYIIVALPRADWARVARTSSASEGGHG